MTLLDKYVLRKFLYVCVYALVAFWVIFLVVDIIEHIDLFIDRGAGFVTVLKYYLYYSPFILAMVLPVAMLLSSLFSLGILAKNNELTAMKVNGISLYRTLSPLLILGFLVSLLVLGINELVIPYTNQKKTYTREVEIEKKAKPRDVLYQNVYAQGEDGRIFYLNLYDSKKKEGKEVLVQRFENNRLKEQIEAKVMRWRGTGWLFENGSLRFFLDSLEQSEAEEFQRFSQLQRRDIKIKPEAFTKQQKKPEEMNYKELSHYAKLKKKAGQDVSKELTDLHMKLAYPFISFIIVLFGSPLAASPKRGSLSINFAITLGIAFTYWFLLRTAQTFGHTEKLPPFLAAWITNFIFAGLGIFLLIKARK
jgi:lipopolysaccharide export system permease protein